MAATDRDRRDSRTMTCQRSRPTESETSWYLRIAMVLAITALQLATFYLTYKLYAVWGYQRFVDVETFWDRFIPYVRWSWTVYYFGFAYVIFWGAAGIWGLSTRAFRRTGVVFAGLIIAGTILRLVIPTNSPWQFVHELAEAQRSFKTTCGIEPLAGFPSMHVAMAVLSAFISLFVFRGRLQRVLSVLLALLVCASVVTAKEHWSLDVLGGMILGLAAGWVWKAWAYDSQ